MPDYTQSKIYKITSVHTDECYIGSTTRTLEGRFSEHMRKSNKCRSKIISDFGDCKIELITAYPCNSQNEIQLIETYYIRKNKCVNKSSNSCLSPRIRALDYIKYCKLNNIHNLYYEKYCKLYKIEM